MCIYIYTRWPARPSAENLTHNPSMCVHVIVFGTTVIVSNSLMRSHMSPSVTPVYVYVCVVCTYLNMWYIHSVWDLCHMVLKCLMRSHVSSSVRPAHVCMCIYNAYIEFGNTVFQILWWGLISRLAPRMDVCVFIGIRNTYMVFGTTVKVSPVCVWCVRICEM